MQRLIGAALAFGACACALAWAPQARAQDAMVGIDAGDDAFLYGSLLRPAATDPAPYVLIVPASGTVDRNGDSAGAGPKPDTYELLARGLAAKGIGSLRTDRRGIAGSAAAVSDESKITLDTYIDDTVAWAKFLSLQPQVKCVLLLGHSEGALVAALAAQKVKTCGVIEIAGAGRPAGEVLEAQLKAAKDKGNLSDETYAAALKILTELRAGRTVSDVPLALASLFRPALQPYLISWLGRDPVAAQANLYPVLIIQGDHDAQVSVDDARRLANVSRAIRLVVLPNVDHALKTTGSQASAGVDGAAPLAPGVIEAIADFIAKPPAQAPARR
ncbi:MAG TPA: alpha/beta fold hydrolase [Caulobacteraceae bacterium]|nr:alpha/beta fold hydrolase [Caulobacteraceae bacterium]